MKKLLLLAIATIMSLGASAQLITQLLTKKVVVTTASVYHTTQLVQMQKVQNLSVVFL